MQTYDVIIVGGGAAGLSAALMLGRARRSVLVCDAGKPRNWASSALHGFISREGMRPADLLTTTRQELQRYPTVKLVGDTVVDAIRQRDRFEVTMATNGRAMGRKLLLATGISDELPALEGIETFYGKTVHHCPYCDGWEHRDEPIAVYGGREKGRQVRADDEAVERRHRAVHGWAIAPECRDSRSAKGNRNPRAKSQD